MKTLLKSLKKGLNISILGVMGLIISCTDLDKELYSTVTFENFFKSDEEFISVMSPAYSSLIGIMGGHNATWSIQEVSTDELIIPRRGNEWSDDQWLRMYRHEYRSTDEAFNNSWTQLYGGVSNCNRLIELFTPIAGSKATVFISELRALRALYYFWLLDLFGNVPIITGFSKIDPKPANQSRAEVYSFVEKELVEVLTLLTTDVSSITYARMTSHAANALLAKLYLNAFQYTGSAQWDKAIAAADAVINSGKFTLEGDYFTNFKTDNMGSRENIFVIPYDKIFAPGFNFAHMSLHMESQKTFNLTEQPWNGYCSLQEFYDAYDTHDLRRKNLLAGPQYSSTGDRLSDNQAELNDPDGKPLTYTPEINEHSQNCFRQAGTRIGKFEYAFQSTPDMSNDFPVFRLADIMLVKAEALWRKTPDNPIALAIVNQIRNRAGVVPFTKLTEEDLLAERGREMFAEGWRRQDLIRFGKYSQARRFKPSDAKDCLDIFPIPQVQLEAGSNLKQNPCY